MSRFSQHSASFQPTTWYMPPEVRTGQACSERGDMWMVGVLAWLILAGPFPQAGMSQEAAWSSIMVGKPAFKGSGWANRSLEAADFVSQLIQVRVRVWCRSVLFPLNRILVRCITCIPCQLYQVCRRSDVLSRSAGSSTVIQHCRDVGSCVGMIVS